MNNNLESQTIDKKSIVDKNLDFEFDNLKNSMKDTYEIKGAAKVRPISGGILNNKGETREKDIENKTSVSFATKKVISSTNVNPKTVKSNKYQGREEKIDSDQYYNLKDENERLKLHQYKLNDEVKRYNLKTYF
jgi:hypothetical protein